MRVVEAISGWARRASSWADLGGSSEPSTTERDSPTGMIYRLRHWPTLPPSLHTADVLRLLSRMSSGPVSHSWVLRHGKVRRERLERLLLHLRAQEALETINPASFPAAPRGERRPGV
jgi:hypothetical protein